MIQASYKEHRHYADRVNRKAQRGTPRRLQANTDITAIVPKAVDRLQEAPSKERRCAEESEELDRESSAKDTTPTPQSNTP